MVIQVAVQHEGVGGRQRTHVADFRQGLRVPQRFHQYLRIQRAEQGVVLLAVHAGGEPGGQGEGPGTGVVGGVAFVQLESVDAGVHQNILLIVPEDGAGFGEGKVRYHAAPDQSVSGIGCDVVMDGGGGMGEGVLPQVDVYVPLFHFRKESGGIRVQIAPDVGAGVGVGLPAGFQADDVEGNVLFPELVRHGDYPVGGVFGVAAVQHTQSPVGHITAAAGEHIVPGHDVGDVLSFYYINVHPFAAGNLNGHHLPGQFPEGIQIVGVVGGGIGIGVFLYRMNRTAAAIGRIHLIAAVEFRIPGSVHVDPPAFVGDEEGNGRMAVTGGQGRVGIDGQLQLASLMVELFQLQPEAVDLGVGLQREGQHAPPAVHPEPDLFGGEGHRRFGIGKMRTVPGRHMGLGRTVGEFVHSKPPQKSKK